MAQRGRKPKPTAVKVLEGNPGKRSLNTGEPKPEKKAPRCPSWLEEEAKKEWKRMAKQLSSSSASLRRSIWRLCRILPSVCKVEGGGGVYYAARYNREDSKRILAAGTTGFHCPDLP